MAKLLGLLSILLLTFLSPGYASTTIEQKLKALIPIRLDDGEKGYVTILLKDGKAAVETTSGEKVKSASATWKVVTKNLIVVRSFDGSDPIWGKSRDKSTYKLGISHDKLTIDGSEESVAIQGELPKHTWNVNDPN